MRRRTHAIRASIAALALGASAFAPAPPVPDARASSSIDEASDPTGLIASDNVEVLGAVPNPGVIGAKFRGEHMFVSTLTGLTVYDVSTPEAPFEVGRLALPHFENEDVDLGGDILLISNDSAESYGLLFVIDISDPTDPTLRSVLDMKTTAVEAQLFVGPGHTASCILECQFAWVTDGGGYLVVDLRDPDNPAMVGHQPTPAAGSLGITHDVQVDETGLAWTVGFGGTAAFEIPAYYDGTEVLEPLVSTGDNANSRYIETFGLDDGSSVNDFIHHNSLRVGDSDVVYVTEEDYNRPGCRGAGSFQRWHLPMEEDPDTGERFITGADMTNIDMWVTELLADTAAPAAMCSAHYFDVRDGLVAQGWYEQGLRLLDVTGDEIRQVGYFVPPQAMTWAAYFPPTDPTGEIVYSFDASHGIDVLRIDLGDGGAGEAATVVAPIRPEWRVAQPAGVSRAFGFACRL